MDWCFWEWKNGNLVGGAEVGVRSELESMVWMDLGKGVGVDQDRVGVLESGNSAQESA